MPQSQVEPVSKRLIELEEVIDRGRRSFIEVGLALMEIRDSRLYKERGYPSFDDYCRDHWGFRRSYAHDLIQSARAVAELPKVSGIPDNPGQAVELARAPEGERAEVWQKVTESDAAPTAATIRAIVDSRIQTAEVPIERPVRQLPSTEETFRGMLTSAVSYGIVVAELDPAAVRRAFEAALRAALRELKEMT